MERVKKARRTVAALISRPRWLRTMRGAVTLGAVGVAALAGAVLIVGPALLGHGGAPWWVSAQPHIHAIGFGGNICDGSRAYYRSHPYYVPPPFCQGTAWYHGSPPPGEPPPGEPAPPAP